MLRISPEAACANLKVLAASDRLGDYGFFEAIDYTTSRLPPGRSEERRVGKECS